MKLLTLKMRNFRQFYGDSPLIKFAAGDRNITTFHGTNGAGKTALLNAFTWLLFGETTKGFQFPNQIVNLRAIREAPLGEEVDAFVELTFEHQERRYIIKKRSSVVRSDGEIQWDKRTEGDTQLQWAGPEGKWVSEERVQDVIGRILPPDLHSYFFFDGERIERIVQPTKKERGEIAEATKKLLGVEILDRAVQHLNTARRELEKELRDSGDSETRVLLKEKSELENELSGKESRLGEIDDTLESSETRRQEVEHRLRALSEARQLQERRDDLTKDLDRRRTTYGQQKEQLTGLISGDGYTVFLDEAVADFQEIIKDLHDRGELPSGIKKNFVEALLQNERCICGTDLARDALARSSVAGWKEKAGLVDVEERAIRMEGEVRKIADSMPRFLETIDQVQYQMDVTRKAIHQIEGELDDIRNKLESSPREEVGRLERQRETIVEEMRSLTLEYGGVQQRVQDIGDRLAMLDGLVRRHRAHEAKQALLQRQVEASQDAIDRIKRIREILEDEFRVKLVRKIAELFSEISPTPYVPDLTAEYDLRLLNSAGGTAVPVAASEGESQVLSLAFIGSIITLAREFQAKQEHLPGPESSSYPLVMDSPFGKLGPTYRQQIASHIPRLADQVVVLVTDTQWRGEVEESMRARRGKSYVLTYYTPKSEVKAETFVIDGRAYPLVRESPNEFEYTEINEVPDA